MSAVSSVQARNERAKVMVARWLEAAAKQPLTPNDEKAYRKELAILRRLIPISANGFRGVVLTAIVGKSLDQNYRPLENFYACNPRSIFEQGIYYALADAGVPCGKSDPLNVAKNIQKLDYDWARGRRPEDAAKAAVDYIKLLEESWSNHDRCAKLLFLYFSLLNSYAEFVRSQDIPFAPIEGRLPIETAVSLSAFVVDCPEGGTIPQFIIGQLIRITRENDSRYASVDGVEESVFGTNTTSKKPADVWEVMADGSFGQLYEVTVKTIDRKRLDDCVDALKKLEVLDRPITFICNLPKDTTKLGIAAPYLMHKGVGFQFVDIRSFVISTYCLLTRDQQVTLLERLQSLVFDPCRPVKTKEYWAEHFGNG